MPWVKVNKANPCPICGKPDWCGVTEDGVKVHCMRVQNQRPHTQGGWIHTIGESVGSIKKAPPKKYRQDVPDLAHSYREKRSLGIIGEQLGVSISALHRLWCGWDGEAWTFPMRDGVDHIIGIRRRFESGKKRALTGGQAGLFIPRGLSSNRLFICEGPTDCAALLDMGVDAIGRPSCMTGGPMLVQYLQNHKDTEVVIVADRDVAKYRPDGTPFWPGQEGAKQLSFTLKTVAARTTIIIPKAKDLREWYQKGATKQSLELLIKNSRWIYPYSS